MIRYNFQFDAYYDEEEDRWIENKCNDPECEYCSERPEKPSLIDASSQQVGF